MVNEERKVDYRKAYEDWQIQLAAMHEVLLDGRRTDPVRLKALLNRESRAKTRYDDSRLLLLGIEPENGLDRDGYQVDLN